jgi:hypothetical protein
MNTFSIERSCAQREGNAMVVRPTAYDSGLHDRVRDFLTIAVLISVTALLLALVP